MQKHELINHLIKYYGYQSYLEIGVRNFKTFDLVECARKESIDPEETNVNRQIDFLMTSDQAFQIIFSQLARGERPPFDLIFIDGLHLEQQVDRDIINSLSCLSPTGMIVLHDCNPPTEFHQRDQYEVDGEFPAWNGTVWKSIAKLRITRPDLWIRVVNTDWGCGLIQRNPYPQPLFLPQSNEYSNVLTWKFLEGNRTQLLNLISVEEFKNIFLIDIGK